MYGAYYLKDRDTRPRVWYVPAVAAAASSISAVAVVGGCVFKQQHVLVRCGGEAAPQLAAWRTCGGYRVSTFNIMRPYGAANESHGYWPTSNAFQATVSGWSCKGCYSRTIYLTAYKTWGA